MSLAVETLRQTADEVIDALERFAAGGETP